MPRSEAQQEILAPMWHHPLRYRKIASGVCRICTSRGRSFHCRLRLIFLFASGSEIYSSPLRQLNYAGRRGRSDQTLPGTSEHGFTFFQNVEKSCGTTNSESSPPHLPNRANTNSVTSFTRLKHRTRFPCQTTIATYSTGMRLRFATNINSNYKQSLYRTSNPVEHGESSPVLCLA